MNPKVLIVDDEPVALHMLEEALKIGGFEILRAYGAEDALRKVKLRKPDIVLTDLEMPGLNGVELIAMIKRDPDIQGTPVIAVTSHTWDTIGQAAAQVGASGQIAKPFSPQQLVEKVRECLALRLADPELGSLRLGLQESRRARAPVPLLRPAVVPDASEPVPPSGAGAPIFNRDAFLEYVDGDRANAQRAIAVLLGNLPSRLESIRGAIAYRDGEALRTTAHAVKGAVAFFAAPVVVAAAYRLEMMGDSGDLTEAGAVYFDLERAIADLTEALQEFVREIANGPVPRLHLARSR